MLSPDQSNGIKRGTQTISVPTEKGRTMDNLREKLIELLWEYDQMRMMRMSIEECADHLIANGVTITPAAPGPSESDPNIMELCFHNGEQHMKEKMISQLRSVAGSMPCIALAQVIKIVEDL